ncbi:MAG: tetratricopeptide repeat protein [Phycisphaerae bacterium]
MNAARLVLAALCVMGFCLAQGGCKAHSVAASPADRYADPPVGQYDKAIAHYTGIIKARPNDVEGYFGRGFTYSLKEQYGPAIEDFNRVLAIKPDYVDAYNDRGAAYFHLGLYRSAIRDYTRAVELKPDYALVYANRALAYYYLKDYDNAWADVKMCRNHGGQPDPSLIEFLSKASGRSE